jgi:hypothetical protein
LLLYVGANLEEPTDLEEEPKMPTESEDAEKHHDCGRQAAKLVAEQIHVIISVLLGCICMHNQAAENLVGSKLELLRLKMEVRAAVRTQSAVDGLTDVHRALLAWASITSTSRGVLQRCITSDEKATCAVNDLKQNDESTKKLTAHSISVTGEVGQREPERDDRMLGSGELIPILNPTVAVSGGKDTFLHKRKALQCDESEVDGGKIQRIIFFDQGHSHVQNVAIGGQSSAVERTCVEGQDGGNRGSVCYQEHGIMGCAEDAKPVTPMSPCATRVCGTRSGQIETDRAASCNVLCMCQECSLCKQEPSKQLSMQSNLQYLEHRRIPPEWLLMA